MRRPGPRWVVGWSIVAALLVVTALLIGCAKEEPNVEKLMVAEGLAPAAAPLFVADAQNLWEAEALDVTPQAFMSGKLCMDAVIGGKAEFGTVAETPLAHAGLQGQAYYVVCTFMSSGGSVKGIAKMDAGIAKPEDLKGKKVATLIGTSAEFYMDTFLEAHGLSSADVKVTNLAPPDMVTAIMRGDVDACFIWEPHIHNMKKALGDEGLILWQEGLYTETFNLVTLQEYAKQHPEIIERVLKTLLRAEELIRGNRDEAIQIVSEVTGLDTETLGSIWQYYDFRIELGSNLLTYLQKQGDWAKAKGNVPAMADVPDYRQFIYTQGLQKVRPGRVNL